MCSSEESLCGGQGTAVEWVPGMELTLLSHLADPGVVSFKGQTHTHTVKELFQTWR